MNQLAHGGYYNGLGGSTVARWDNGSQRFYCFDGGIVSYAYDEFSPLEKWLYDQDVIPFSKIVATDEYRYKKC